MPNLSRATRNALAALMDARQPNLRLSTELMTSILGYYVEERPEEETVWQAVKPIIFTCKLFKQLVIPLLYKSVHLKSLKSYTSFLREPHLESYRHIKYIHLSDVCFGTKGTLKRDEDNIKALESKAAQYKKAVGKRIIGVVDHKSKEGVANDLWPKGVNFFLDCGGEEKKNPQRAVYICRMMKLFSASEVSLSTKNSFSPRATFSNSLADPFCIDLLTMPSSSLEHHYTPAAFRSAPIHDLPITQLFLSIKIILSDPPQPSIVRHFNGGFWIQVTETVVPKRRLLEDAIHRAGKIELACEDAIETVQVMVEGHPHAFCRKKVKKIKVEGEEDEEPKEEEGKDVKPDLNQNEEEKKPVIINAAKKDGDEEQEMNELRFPKLRLISCPASCSAVKTEWEEILNRVFRSTKDLQQLRMELL